MAEGLTREQAQAIIDRDGALVAARHQAREKADAEELRPMRDQNRERFPKQPWPPQSVQDVPAGGFETNRRRH